MIVLSVILQVCRLVGTFCLAISVGIFREFSRVKFPANICCEFFF